MARRPEMLQEVRVKAGSGQDGLSADGAKTVYGGMYHKPEGKGTPGRGFLLRNRGINYPFVPLGGYFQNTIELLVLAKISK
jgi:hypothetical protein